MRVDHLQVFITAANTQNFSEVARQLHMSQPTVSQIIKQLEGDVGTRLFRRTTHKVELTEAGRLFLPYAHEILRLYEESKTQISLTMQTIQGPLRIGSSLTTSEVLLPKLLAVFRQRYPQVYLDVRVANSEQILQMLLADQLDFGMIEAPLTSDKLQIDPVMEDELVCVSAAEAAYPAIHKESKEIKLEHLVSLPLVMREPGSGTRMVLEEVCTANHIPLSRLHIVVELNSTEAIKEAVEAGLGVSVLSRHSVRKELELGRLRTLSFSPFPLKRKFYTVHRAEEPVRPVVKAIRQLFVENSII